jgi:hypothetical protein
MKTLILLALLTFCLQAERTNAASLADIRSHHHTSIGEHQHYPNNVGIVSYTDEPRLATTPDSKRQFCLFWGLIGNCGFQSSASVESSMDTQADAAKQTADVHEANPNEIQNSISNPKEHRSILWGAVQWSSRNTAGARTGARSDGD